MTVRLVASLLAYSSLALTAQQPPAESSAQAPAARFGAAASGVVVDVVVRDKRGRPVSNLSAADFSVFEDGVRQQVLAFEPYTAADVPQTVDEAAAAAGLPASGKGVKRHRLAEGPPVIALAWDRLEPEGRALAYRAAQRLIQTKADGELVGVFLTDMTLRTIQPYTTDRTKLGVAVTTLGTAATSSLKREPVQLDTLVGRAAVAPTASAEDGGHTLAGFPKQVAVDYATREIIRMLERMDRTYQAQLYEQQGRASMLGLYALVDSLGELPGRKTVFYFCEGLTIPDSQLSRFRSVIDAANRNNVSVYTLDTAGLRVHSAQQQTSREMRELTFAGLGSEASKPEALTQNLESNERLLKMDPSVSLGILADQTGGLLVDNTNALDRGVDRITDDRRHHYLLSYVSTNSALDGSYRRIVVSVNRPDVEVRARRGYRASADTTTAPVLEHERPALAALATAPPPADFPILARALRTPMPDRRGLISVLVGVNGNSLAMGQSEDGAQFFVGAMVLTRIVDAGSKEVARASEPYHFTGDFAQRHSGRRGILFFKTASLAPGTYTLEAVCVDAMSDRRAVSRLPITALESVEGGIIGDLFVVARVDAVPADVAASTHPLVWEGRLHTPSLGEPIRLSSQTHVTVALPTVVAGTAPSVRVEALAGPSVLTATDLSARPGPDGRLIMIGRLALEALPTGQLELRATIRVGERTVVRSTSLTLVP